LRNEHAVRSSSTGLEPISAFFFSVVDPTQLRAGDVYWDDPATPQTETKYEVLESCFDEAGRVLETDLGLGPDPTKWAWGHAMGLRLTSDLSAFGITKYDNPPPGGLLWANAGGYESVDPTNPALDTEGWVQHAGASARLVCEVFPDGPKCDVQLPGGQSAHIDSPNYEDLLLKYLEDEPIELVFDIEEAKANAVRTVTFD
jgi:acyl-homoserine lactone acylase PvdQ